MTFAAVNLQGTWLLSVIKISNFLDLAEISYHLALVLSKNKKNTFANQVNFFL